MASIIKVDDVQDAAGNNIIREAGDTITIGASGDTITIPSGATITNSGTATGFGKILQAVSTSKTDTFTTTTTGSWVDVTGLTVAITPASTSNKVLVLVNIVGAHGADQMFWKILRDSTDISVGASAGSRIPSSGGNLYNLANSSRTQADSCAFLDSPSSTSSLTYKIQTRSGSATSCINRSSGDADAVSANRAASNITVMEVAG
jgi:hypothetical protein